MTTGHDITIQRGATYRKPFLFQQPEILFRRVTEFRRTSPIEIVSVAHGIPDQWPIWLEDVKGAASLQRSRPAVPMLSSRIDADTLDLPSTDGFGSTAASGTLVYHAPVDLAGATARMSFWLPDGTLATDYTETSGLVIDPLGRITLDLTAATTLALTWDNATYELDVTFPDATVLHYDMGNVMVTGRMP